MVKVTKADAAKNKADVLKAAGQAVRKDGIQTTSVGSIAKKAGLTHGAVYRHFASKDDLAAAAITADFAEVVSDLERIKARSGKIEEYLNAYLSIGHRDYYVWGCPAAALSGEISRSAEDVQKAFVAGLANNLEAITHLISDKHGHKARQNAIGILASLSGALALARATKIYSPKLSEEILEATKAEIIKMINAS